MPRRRSALLRHAAAGAATLTLVTACSTGSDTPAAPEPTASTSGAADATDPASTTPTPTAEPGPPEPPPLPESPRFRPGPKGQTAFARHVIASWAWALQANDATPLLEASRSRKRPCTGCRDLVRELRGRDQEQWYVDLPPVRVDRTRLRRAGDEIVATSRVDLPESETYFYDGAFRSTSPAHRDATFVVRMRKASERYVLTSFTIG